MQSISVQVRADEQARVVVELPPEMAGRRVQMFVLFETLASSSPVQAGPREETDVEPESLEQIAVAHGWPPGFFEETIGSIPDFPDIESEGQFEVRERLG